MDAVTIEIVLAIVFIFLLYLALRQTPGIPPGVWGWPIVGKLPSKSRHLSDQVSQLRESYGDIISWRMGWRVHVFLCNFHTIKKAMERPELSNRPDFYIYSVFSDGASYGLAFSNGSHWQRNRRFTLRQIQSLGLVKTPLEEAMQEEAKLMVEDFKKHTGKNEPLPKSLNMAILNVMLRMVADRPQDAGDDRTEDLMKLLLGVKEHLQGQIFAFNLFPWLKTLAPSFLKKKMGFFAFQESVTKFQEAIAKMVKENQSSLNPAQPRNMIDHYLIEMQQMTPPDPTFSVRDLKVLISDLILAGFEAMTTYLRWSVLYLAKYPEVQEKLQRDIDTVVPRGSFLLYHDRHRLPYLEAVLHEIHRLAPVTPLGVPHAATQETQIEGYTIPQGTIVAPHIESCHKDAKFWSQPDKFYPDHFLNSDGTFNGGKDGFLPFSIGRRSCAGEGLAKVVTFVFLTALLQNFTFAPAKGHDLSTEKDPKLPFVNAPKPYNVVINLRE